MKEISENHGKRGLTLIEILVAMGLLSILAGAIIASALQVRKLAEDNLYQISATTAASGYLEQILGMSFNSVRAVALDNSLPLPTRINETEVQNIFCGHFTEVKIPIISEENEHGDVVPKVSMKMEIQALLRDLRPEGIDALEIGIVYAWYNPGNNQRYERTLKTIRSSVR